MNLFQIILKQMRQRALSTWLTALSVLLGVALAVTIMLVRRESASLFGQTDYGYDVLVGAKGSPLQLVLNTVYHIDKSPGNIPYSLYEEMTTSQQYRAAVRMAIPLAVGDSYKGLRIIGTTPRFFGYDDDQKPIAEDRAMEYRPGRRYAIAAGRSFHPRKFEAVIGSEVTKFTGLKIGDTFKATHGMPKPGEAEDIHDEVWTVVGQLAATHTASDRILIIPLITFYSLTEHEDALKQQASIREGADPSTVGGRQSAGGETVGSRRSAVGGEEKSTDAHDHSATTRAAAATIEGADADHAHDAHDDHDDHSHAEADRAADHDGHDHDHGEHDAVYTRAADGTIDLHLPKEDWALSAILVRSRSPFFSQQLLYVINNRNEAAAVNPASVMRDFFRTFLEPVTMAWGAVAYLVNLVAIVAILVSIYNSVSARMRDIAILRALGATRLRVLAIICLEAGAIGFIGAVLGVAAGHGLAAAASFYLERSMGESIRWWVVGGEEIVYLFCVTLVAILAGLVPALKAYRSPVATNLTAV